MKVVASHARAKKTRMEEVVALEGAQVRANLRIKIKNFGPVYQGDVVLKPLTIFIGPNNSGKSYTAMLIHSILSAENKLFPLLGSIESISPEITSNIYEKFKPDLKNVVKNVKGSTPVIPPSLGIKIRNYISNDLFKKIMDESITGSFGSKTDRLVQKGYNSASIDVGSIKRFSISISEGVISKFNPNKSFTYDLKPQLVDEIYATIEKVVAKDNQGDTKLHVFFTGIRLVRAIADSIAMHFRVPGAPSSSFYFPAARSGLLQAQKVISSGLMKAIPFAGIHNFQMPKLTGVVSDFVSTMLQIGSRPGPFSKLAKAMELELLRGQISLEKEKDEQVPEIYYQADGLKIPLYMTSSTVSEVAPLSLYLKHEAVPGLLLIIEEPEAHLHASNQVILAKYIVKMLRAGLNVLVTTHSPVIVDVLGTYMRSSAVDPSFRKKMGFDPNDYLEINEVAPYKFVKSTKRGYEIKKIRTNLDEGIPQSEYIRVIEDLYRNMAQLERKLRE